MEIELKGKRISVNKCMNVRLSFVCKTFARQNYKKNRFSLSLYFDVVSVYFVLFKSIKSYIVFYLNCGTRFWCKSSGLLSGYNLDKNVCENRMRCLFDYTVRTLANSLNVEITNVWLQRLWLLLLYNAHTQLQVKLNQ